MKFLVDMPFTPQAVAYLQAAGHEAATRRRLGFVGDATRVSTTSDHFCRLMMRLGPAA